VSSERNRLGDETSPYLLQHRDNPVHWWPWGDDAFAAAREQDKPILLSVGYAACHWCHVMAHESFENDAIADQMNRDFINIKVDREERPDVDAIYQKALAATGEHGGWPLTMFLKPDGKPFFGGTYFPPEDRYGRPGFPVVLTRLAEVYKNDRDMVDGHADKLTAALDMSEGGELKDPLTLATLDECAAHLADHFDYVDGGLGGAPKFPMTDVFEFLWRGYLRSGDTKFATAVRVTLDRICQGGIYDHLGGGFARYSTDPKWLAPHFEKMLYDNAQLIDVLTTVWQETNSALYATRIEETIDWLMREMIGENGAFAATLDADSEGEEGKFYVWGEAEIDTALKDFADSDVQLFKDIYDVSAEGNWEHKIILNRIDTADVPLTPEQDEALAKMRTTLFEVRAPRIRPGRDDKVLADWNGLMIQALAHAGLVFGRDEWIDLARTAFAAIVATMQWQDDSGRTRLGHSLCAGKLQQVDLLDDYAAMSRAALELFTVTGDDAYLNHAMTWSDHVEALFSDAGRGGYFFTASDAEHLIVRTASVTDSATPSGNGVMLGVLARLYYLTGDDRWQARAEKILERFAGDALRSFPHTCCLLNGFELYADGLQVVIIGPRGGGSAVLMRAALDMSKPTLMLSVVADPSALPETHPARGKTQLDGQPTAYICRGPVCQAPVTAPDDLRTQLAS
jgi:uncharacterized protein YyaL (SSP411 family)